MKYYLVPLIGSGTLEDPLRPDVPENIPYTSIVGKDKAVIKIDKVLDNYIEELTKEKAIEVIKQLQPNLPDERVRKWVE